MNVTTRDLFNYVNTARRYQSFLRDNKLQDGEMDPEHWALTDYDDVLEAKRNGTLAGEQVQHDRSNDEVDCG